MKLTGTWVCMFCGAGGELGHCTAASKHGCLHFVVLFLRKHHIGGSITWHCWHYCVMQVPQCSMLVTLIAELFVYCMLFMNVYNVSSMW